MAGHFPGSLRGVYGDLRMLWFTGATHPNSVCSLPFSVCAALDRDPIRFPRKRSTWTPPLYPQLLGAHSQPRGTSSVPHGVSPTPSECPFSSPLSCSMKHTFPLVLKAKVSGVMHRVWKMAAWATLRMDRLHSRHTAQASCSLRPRSRRERMSARDTFSCQDRLGLSPQRAAPGRT